MSENCLSRQSTALVFTNNIKPCDSSTTFLTLCGLWTEPVTMYYMRLSFVYYVTISHNSVSVSSVLWHYWLGIRKSIRPVKKLNYEVLAWLSVCSKVQMICIWSSLCHCQPIISFFIKIQIGLTFLVPAYPGCHGKRDSKMPGVVKIPEHWTSLRLSNWTVT